MKGKNTFKNSKKLLETNEKLPQYIICTDCEISSCKGCGLYREMTEKPVLAYSELLQKTLSEKNILLLKGILYTMIGFLASVINFSRLADFEEEQLYLETIILSVICYLISLDVKIGIEALIGGLFHWYLAFRTKNKMLIVLVMTFLQVKSYGVRQLEWFAMINNLFHAFYAHYREGLKTYYVYTMLIPLPIPYIYYVIKVGVYLEELFVCITIIFAARYYSTGDIQHCRLRENILNLIFWLVLKGMREINNFSGFGFKLF